MTEASHQMCSNPIEGQRKPGTVGKGTGVDVAILDKTNVVVTEPDTEGEVCIRGKNVTKGYIGANSEKINEEAFAGGWFHTGDQGILDADGYLQLTGRIKELINRAGKLMSRNHYLFFMFLIPYTYRSKNSYLGALFLLSNYEEI